MISRETENVKSSEEIESAFRALSSEGKPYVTKEELYQVGLWEGPKFLGTTEAKGCNNTLTHAHTRACMHTHRSLCLLADSPSPTPPYLRALVMVELTIPPLLQNLTREQADYCVSHMKPYVDGKGRELPTAFDYIEFTRSLFVN